MKIKTIYRLTTAFVISYLFGAFYSVSFNIACWSEITRFSVLGLAGLLAMLIMMHNLLDV